MIFFLLRAPQQQQKISDSHPFSRLGFVSLLSPPISPATPTSVHWSHLVITSRSIKLSVLSNTLFVIFVAKVPLIFSLIDYRRQFQPDTQPLYIGKPSLKQPKVKKQVQYWFGTYGAGVCFSRSPAPADSR